jgi:cytoskeletal protein CcmA (bactofilin family)
MFGKQVYSFDPWRKRKELTMKKIDKISTFIGQDAEFEGKLRFHGAIRIDGHFKGEISGEGTLIVGEGATIDSDIHVSQILNSGEIKGNVITDKRIEVTASGKVLGDIQSPTMVVSDGAVIDGNCRMHETEKKDERKLAVVTLDKSEKDLLPESSPEEHSDAISRG